MALLYYGLIASPMYVSEAKFAVRSPDNSGGMDFAAAIFKSTSSTTADGHVLAQYVKSLDIAKSIDTEVGLVDHFTDQSKDAISRLWQNPTQDELLRYWQWAVTLAFDPDTGILGIKVKAYTPEMAEKINASILRHSEILVNEINKRARQDAIELARAEVIKAEERLLLARSTMKQFRDANALLDPKASAAGTQGIVTELEGEGAKIEAELAEARSYMRDDAPRVVALKSRLDAIRAQFALERRKLASMGDASNPLSAVVAEYERYVIEEEFAQRQYVGAMSALEAARVHADAKSRYVVAFQQPSLPDESLYPRPLIMTGVTFLGGLIFLGLISLIWAAIREHAGF
ncbi:capsule biosynthesis protein [Desulfomicrobium sp. ZS1]|uniref:capsule biosynthesis protein n=1 Tax=Desulfomicrobium sp. ZS1 TaxID=2952228 RepID=UPI0020B43C71|nr:capsule biosynthesis protein [Desulfomicrobium sp. ZS1]UTF51204.1 capsule biosynthesis protein [Desulfomicrobium sp. ZS1]